MAVAGTGCDRGDCDIQSEIVARTDVPDLATGRGQVMS